MKNLAYSNKAQLGGAVYLLLVIVLTGVMLAVFAPTINDFRLERINEIDNYPDQANTFSKIFLYALMPLMWISYIILSVFVLFVGIRQLQG
jgi:ABC-type multidrug transport system permease subunit